MSMTQGGRREARVGCSNFPNFQLHIRFDIMPDIVRYFRDLINDKYLLKYSKRNQSTPESKREQLSTLNTGCLCVPTRTEHLHSWE